MILDDLRELLSFAQERGDDGFSVWTYEDLCTINKALAALKREEPMEPILLENPYIHTSATYCGRCMEPIAKFAVGQPYKPVGFCQFCGQAVKWNEQP